MKANNEKEKKGRYQRIRGGMSIPQNPKTPLLS
jgi:hypothetical protein